MREVASGDSRFGEWKSSSRSPEAKSRYRYLGRSTCTSKLKLTGKIIPVSAGTGILDAVSRVLVGYSYDGTATGRVVPVPRGVQRHPRRCKIRHRNPWGTKIRKLGDKV